MLVLTFSTSALADCRPAYQTKIESIESRLLGFKHREKKILLGTGIGVGVPTGIFMGTMFGLIADGATIPISILEGVLFGSVAGGFAAGAVAVPLITYNQIQKARIRGLSRVDELLAEVRDRNVSGKRLLKLQRQLGGIDMNELITKIEAADQGDAFCQEGELFRMRQVRRYLKGEAQTLL